MTLVEPTQRAGARVLRARAGRARLPRGRRAARPRPLRRRRGRGRRAHGALPHRREPRAVGRRAAASSPTRRPRGASRMIIGEARAVTALWEAARDRLPPAARGPARPAGLRDRRAAGRRRDRAARGDARRPRPPAARVRRRARARARHRPARPRPRRLPLAHVGADRRGPLVALARGRRRALQGRGVGLDAVGGADPAGLGRPRGARPRLRARAGCATSAGCCSRRRRPSTLFVRSENARRDRALRVDRHAASARVPERPLLRRVSEIALASGSALGCGRARRLRRPPLARLRPTAARVGHRRVGCPARMRDAPLRTEPLDASVRHDGPGAVSGRGSSRTSAGTS